MLGREGGATDLIIALVNNMPAAARRDTEQQFSRLLAGAGRIAGKQIRLVALDGLLGRTDDTLRLLDDARPDGLIVTGSEPRSLAMEDEPVWPGLARLIDWARDSTVSTIWSCLAAHAAVFRLDQIGRRKLPVKLSGVFMCAKAHDHALTAGVPLQWKVPHSRTNGLEEAELLGAGYTVLSHAPQIGPDVFVKPSGTSLFVMMQGHPEYGAGSLLSEYRRDVRRFLSGRRDTYPEMPEGYFATDAMPALERLRAEGSRRPGLDLLERFDAAVGAVTAESWHEPAVRLYAGWLSYLAEQVRAGAARPDRQWRVAS